MLPIHLLSAFVFTLAGFIICFGAMLIVRIMSPKRPSAEKRTVYECGEPPIGPGQFRLNMRFYTMALIFIVFDVEVVAVLPPAVVFRSWLESGAGQTALAEILLFVGVLAIGLVYVWRKGDIDWIKDLAEPAQ